MKIWGFKVGVHSFLIIFTVISWTRLVLFTILIFFFQSAIESAQFGVDLPSAEKLLQEHHSQHEAIVNFQTEVDKVDKNEVLLGWIWG